MADFSNAYSSTLSVLYNSYCINVYGSQLWCFNDYISVERLYIACRKTIRRIWRIDKRTHNVLTNLINGCLPINIMLEKRCIFFIWNSFNCTHELHKAVAINMRDMYKLKLLKFYYKLSYDLLPPYFNNYIDIIEQKLARDLRLQFIHAPLVKRVYAECSPLFQLIKLINSLKNDANDTILEKIDEKSHSYNGFAFNVTRCCLDTYDPICRIENCYVCKFQ